MKKYKRSKPRETLIVFYITFLIAVLVLTISGYFFVKTILESFSYNYGEVIEVSISTHYIIT